MKRNRSNFVVGVVIGSLLVLLVWYYQKSTSAENGALALLDRLAEAQKRMRLAQMDGPQRLSLVPDAVLDAIEVGETVDVVAEKATDATAVSSQSPIDALQQVNGIGPVFAERLHAADVSTITAVAALSALRLAEILDINEGRAENILEAVTAYLQDS